MRDNKKKPEGETLRLLDDVEVALKRLLRGIFKFLFTGIPNLVRRLWRSLASIPLLVLRALRRWFGRVARVLAVAARRLVRWLRGAFSYAGEVLLRVGRVLVFFALLVAILEAPILLTSYWDPLSGTWMRIMALGWFAAVGVCGAIWGMRYYFARSPSGRSVGLDEEPLDAAIKVWSARSVFFAGIVGLLPASGLMLASNWSRLGNRRAAQRTWVASAIVFFAGCALVMGYPGGAGLSAAIGGSFVSVIATWAIGAGQWSLLRDVEGHSARDSLPSVPLFSLICLAATLAITVSANSAVSYAHARETAVRFVLGQNGQRSVRVGYAPGISTRMASAVAQRLAACSWPPGESVVLELSGRGRVSLNFGVRASRAGLSHLGDFALRCAATIAPALGEAPFRVHLVGLDGRELRALSMLSAAARPFQDPVDLGFELCRAYFETGRRLYYKREFASAGRAFEGLVEVFERMGGDAGPATGRAGEYLGWLRIACANAERLGVSAEMDELVRVAESCASNNPEFDGSYDLLEITLSRARLLVANKRVEDVEKMLVRSINLSQAALVRADWHWYLRRSIGRAYRILAGVYEASSEYDLEIGARQGYMNVWGEAFQSLDSGGSHKLSQDHEVLLLEALRSEMAKPRSVREFSVECRVGDGLERVTVYATAVRWPKDPLEDQSEYLRRYRSVIIPEGIREKFRRVHKFAHDKDVSFVEACAVEFGSEVLSR